MSTEAPANIVANFSSEQAKITAEMRELDLLIESTQPEVNRLKTREESARTKLDGVRGNPADFQREELVGAGDEFAAAQGRRLTMEGQLGSLQAKRKLLDRVQTLVAGARDQLAEYSAPPMPAGASPVLDENKLLQAVVDTHEEERRRIAPQVHAGPAQATANVLLQSVITQRLYAPRPA